MRATSPSVAAATVSPGMPPAGMNEAAQTTPGTATEPVALYAFTTLLQRLRFGYGSSLSIIVFLVSLGAALSAMWLLMRETPGARER